MEFHQVLPNLKNMPRTASEGDQTDWLPQLPSFHQEEPLINIISDLFLYESLQCLEDLATDRGEDISYRQSKLLIPLSN